MSLVCLKELLTAYYSWLEMGGAPALTLLEAVIED